MVESFVGTDVTMSDEIKEKSDHLDKGSELTMEDKANNIMHGGAGMTWMLNFMGKKLGKRKKHKGKISPSSPQMMRTISIHHLECTDFHPEIQVGQTGSYSDSSKKSLFSDSLAISVPESQELKATHELRKRREAGTVLNRWRDLKEKIKHVIMENRKEKIQVSRDRILHKVPFGHKLLEDMKDKKLNLCDDSASERFDRAGEGRYFNNAKFARKSFLRSCSLTESLDKYSHMLENLSSNENGEVLENSIPIRKDNGLGRILSSPAFRSYSFSKTFLSEVPLELSGVLMAEPFGSKMEEVVRSKSIREDDSLPQDKVQKNFGQILTPESFGIVMEKSDCEPEMVVDSDSLFGVEEEIKSDKFVTPDVESITEMIESQINPVSVDENEQTEPYLLAEVVEDESDFVNTVGSSKYLLREGLELQPMPIKSDTLFEFVRYTLSKSEYGVLFHFLSPSYKSARKFDTPFDQKLIYDLINEVLLEIYEYSTAPNRWLLHFHSKIRSMPAGDFLLQDVWNEVRWNLCAPQGLDATLDDLMAYDFAKNDWWMNLYRDAECVGLQLEDLILDDLLDEAVDDSDGVDF